MFGEKKLTIQMSLHENILNTLISLSIKSIGLNTAMLNFKVINTDAFFGHCKISLVEPFVKK